MEPSEIVKTSEFQVYERSLYKVRAAHGLLPELQCHSSLNFTKEA